MGASLEQGLMTLGSFVLDHDWDPDLLDVPYGTTLRLWWDEQLEFGGPLTRKPRRSKDGLTFAARSHEFWLGVDEDGPVVEDIEFVAQNNKLSNPGAELGLLYWRTGENSKWVLDTVNQQTGTQCFAVVGDPESDDILAFDRSFEAEPGQEFILSLWAKRLSGSRGILRGRVVAEGSFLSQNLLVDPSMVDEDAWGNGSEFPADVAWSSGEWRIGPTSFKQIVPNPGFETGDLDDWIVDADGVYADNSGSRSGAWEAAMQGGPSVGGVISTDGLTVVPGERYHLEGFTRIAGAVTLGPEYSVGGTLLGLYPGAPTDPGPFEPLWTSFEGYTQDHLIHDYWSGLAVDLDIPDGVTSVWISATFYGTEDDGLYHLWDDIGLKRIKGNTCRLMATEPFQVTPEHSYHGFFAVQSEATMTEGTLKVVAQYQAAASSRSDVFVDVGSIDNTEGQAKLLDFSLNPPSGYDFCYLHLIGTDITGGSFIVSSGRVVDNDQSTRVFESWSAETEADYTEHWPDNVVVMPEGTERVHAELVAEEGSAGWVVDDIDFHRTGVPISNAADVIDAVLRDPETGEYLMTPGEINGVPPIPYDLRYRNMTCRTILKQFSRAVMQPPREWRANPDNTLDWGLPEQLYTDRTDFVLKPGDVELLEDPETEESAESSVQVLKVIGGQTVAVGKRQVPIEATATNDPGDKVDYFNRPWARKRVITDSTVDHPDHAEVLARYEADRNADRRQNVRLRLADWKALAKFDVGDWIYVHEPDAGLEDLTNPVSIEGRTYYPQRVRVLSRTWRPGNDFRAELRYPDGSLTPLSDHLGEVRGVLWNTETTAEIEVGDLLPEFIADSQGGSSSDQFLRYVASSAR